MTPQKAWKDLKQKINVQYYIGPHGMSALNEFIGEPPPEPTAADTAAAADALNKPAEESEKESDLTLKEKLAQSKVAKEG